MNFVDLQRPDLLPNVLQKRLQAIEPICRVEKYSEELVQRPEVREIIIALNDYCTQRRILGIHYTRAIRADIERKGLLVRTGVEIRADFIRRFGHKFYADEIEQLQNLWSSHQTKQSISRDSLLCFNFTLMAYGNSGSKYLLGMYGGEQIHMGIEIDSPIGKKLGSIGEPLLIKCSLEPQEVQTRIEYPWGKILMSSFHLSANPDVYRIDQVGRVSKSILPEDLVIEQA